MRSVDSQRAREATYDCAIVRRATGFSLLGRTTAAPNKMLSSNALGAVVQLGNRLWDRLRQSEGGANGHHKGDAGEEGLELHDRVGCLCRNGL